MAKMWLAHFNDVPLTLAAFIIFMCTFGMTLLWTFRKNSKPYYDKISELPLKDGDSL
ncbi:MAG: CcoQ/FixQ family Cbb3-type cytochrome c oxidase assembly chaperone [Bdellovibrionaceae bacterium]|nr:CcoQ/FixQ family Cbb3-type cytochrome c oxidase assembly chaperone [Pseudobdellovibrionaceae bacterium]